MNLEVSRLKKIKMLVMDVDGVLTDARVFMDSNGEWKRYFSVRDGAGIKRIMEEGYKTAIITASNANDIRVRAKNLGIHYVFEGALDKLPSFEKLVQQTGLKPEEMAYIGDDFFDIPVLERVGFSATVPEAMEEVKEMVHYITARPGGNGAVREVCDHIFRYGAFAKGN